MTIQNQSDGKLIILSKPFDSRPKILNVFYFLSFTAIGFGIWQMLTFNQTPSIAAIIFVASALSIYLFAAYKFINKAMLSEKLTVYKGSLTVSKSGFLSTNAQAYDTERITNFRHLDHSKTTKHPLAGQSFDYLGFETQQAVINEMHGDNRLAFDYNGNTVTFGINVFSWEFDQLEAVFFEVTGLDLRRKKEPDTFDDLIEKTEDDQQVYRLN